MHTPIDPAILYFGTPVVLVSSLNADGSTNLAPMSSIWWLGRTAMLGFGARSHTPANIIRTGECVLNLAAAHNAPHVDRLARTTGADPVPPHKVAMRYEHVGDKFAHAAVTPLESVTVTPRRIAECPVHLEAVLEAVHPVAEHDPDRRGKLVALEVRVTQVHVEDALRLAGHEDRVDPVAWQPLLMSFQRLFARGDEVQPSRLAQIPESAYRPRRA